MSEPVKPVQFAPLTSALDVGFWHALSQKKLDDYKLDDQPKPLQGYYYNGDQDGLSGRLCLDFNALDISKDCPPHCFHSHGTLVNFNILDAFKTSDKINILQLAAIQIWKDITSKEAIRDPSLLSRFVLLTFADLKKYHYYYWFAFPALCAPDGITSSKPAETINNIYTEEQLQQLQTSYDTLVTAHEGKPVAFFLVYQDGDNICTAPLTEYDNIRGSHKVTFAFCDPCTLEHYPGWPLRNYLALIAYHWGDHFSGQDVPVLCFRDRTREGIRSSSHSVMLSLKLPSLSQTSDCPKCVGWEKNQKQKLAPRKVDLSSSMDPTRLAGSAVDLNLKLMRWRLLPSLDLDCVSQAKCLLLGSGTLGCNVARCLLGWGVRTITLADNARVSYSNPVRQSLFEFEDSLNGGKPKAQTAAEKLKKIFPGVNATGHTLSIPMPGHAVGTSDEAVAQMKESVEQLEELIADHDIVFLLMDTRESRWLPSVIAASKRKLVINAALGFDTYMVVRHGLKLPKETDASSDSCEKTEKGIEAAAAASSSSSSSTAAAAASGSAERGSMGISLSAVPGHQLGCYFCNDVVAPGNSTKDRTLDQQCTVSRPGMSMVAAALAVELMVSVLQHPKKGYAAADTSAKDDHLTMSLVSPLGLVPHQIRGFLSRYHALLPVSLAFDKCTACSETILTNYEKDGLQFLLRAFNEPQFLEDLTGLTQLHADTEDADIRDFDDDESISSLEP
ncbi:ubiquitin-like modifier-activating enzyme ATG7 isoform X2 [Amphiura filiformis]|uniref:ubiquitin-like modifier-activating enzyme ATG7 isoform X2 n=1 Tax=Amphiura filiformis TaxID=82378 RepID=UPI003B214C62